MNIEIKDEDEVVEIESTGGVGVWNECIEAYFIGMIEDEGIDQQPLLPNQLGKKTKKDYSQDQVKNKYNQLRIKWKEFSKILEETGIGYNAVTYQLSIEDVVWKKLYKHYDKLCTIFGDTTATGGSSHPSNQSPSDTEDENETDGEVSNSDKEGEEEGEQGRKTKKAKANVNPKKLREKVNFAVADALVAMSENSKKKLELLERKMGTTNSTTSINESETKGNDQDLLMECIDTLSILEGVDGASFAKATKLIHDDPLWRMIFLRLPDDKEKRFCA
ncbi:ATP-dependent Clp protease ATP-binding subunit ClpX [Bienertia sinuspersici]